MTSEEAFERYWGDREDDPDTEKKESWVIAQESWAASEANAVRTLAGEWGEFEVGPCETLSKAVGIIRDTGRVLLRHVYQDQDWHTWANSKLRGTSYNPVALRRALDKLLAKAKHEESNALPEPVV